MQDWLRSTVMSHYYEFQDLLIPRLSLYLVCVCVCVYALICMKGVCWWKEVGTKKGGSIIGFSIARRHNDTAIDSGMSSREQRTNGRAGGCFSRPLIGWPTVAVGLQVAKWTSKHICSPSTSWRREQAGRECEMWRCDLICAERNTIDLHTLNIIFSCMFSLSLYLCHLCRIIFPFVPDPDILCVRVGMCEYFSGCSHHPHCQSPEINVFHLSLTWLYFPLLLSVSVSENPGLKPRFICLDWLFLNFPAGYREKSAVVWHLNWGETGFEWLLANAKTKRL